MIDSAVEDVVGAMSRELTEVAGSMLVGVYVHGSAVLGDFRPGQSDIDLLIIVEDDADDDVVQAIGDVLFRERDLPAVTLEVSVVDRSVAARARPPWSFRLHLTTLAGNSKSVPGAGHPGDEDLILHYLVTRAHGWCAYGEPVSDVFGEVDHRIVLEQLASELRWGISAKAPESYAVLNACRALRYVEEREICSKTAGGEWALRRGIAPGIVRAALDSRSQASKTPASPDVADWVISVADAIDQRRVNRGGER